MPIVGEWVPLRLLGEGKSRGNLLQKKDPAGASAFL